MSSNPIKSSAKWNGKVGGQNYGNVSPAEMARRNAAYSKSEAAAHQLDAKVRAVLDSYGLPNLGTYLAAARECNKIVGKHTGAILIAELTAILNKWVSAYGLNLVVLRGMVLGVFGINLAPPPDPSCSAGPDDSVAVGAAYTLAGASAADYSSLLWTTLGDGVFENDAIVNAVYHHGLADIIAGNAILRITAQPIPPAVLVATDLMQLTINVPVPKTAPVTFLDYIKSGVGPVTVRVRVCNFVAVGAMSHTINYNPAVLQFIAPIIGLGFPGFACINPVAGTILASGLDAGPGVTYPDGSTVYSLSFNYVGGTSNVTFDNAPAACEYLDPAPAYNPYLAVPFTDYWVDGCVRPL